jgi:AcrR family transcriptional regulator
MESTLLIKRKEAIILATIEVIDECGIQAVSTKEIAKKQGVSERVIFKYFPTKNDLLVAVLDHFGKYDNAIIQTTEAKKMNPIETIIYFFNSYSTYYENYPAITAITQSYDVLQNNPELRDKVKGIFDIHTSFINQQVVEAKRLQLINPDVDSESLTDTVLGTFMRLCLKWRMHEHNFSLRDRTLSIIEMILKSFGA